MNWNVLQWPLSFKGDVSTLDRIPRKKYIGYHGVNLFWRLETTCWHVKKYVTCITSHLSFEQMANQNMHFVPKKLLSVSFSEERRGFSRSPPISNLTWIHDCFLVVVFLRREQVMWQVLVISLKKRAKHQIEFFCWTVWRLWRGDSSVRMMDSFHFPCQLPRRCIPSTWNRQAHTAPITTTIIGYWEEILGMCFFKETLGFLSIFYDEASLTGFQVLLLSYLVHGDSSASFRSGAYSRDTKANSLTTLIVQSVVQLDT